MHTQYIKDALCSIYRVPRDTPIEMVELIRDLNISDRAQQTGQDFDHFAALDCMAGKLARYDARQGQASALR